MNADLTSYIVSDYGHFDNARIKLLFAFCNNISSPFSLLENELSNACASFKLVLEDPDLHKKTFFKETHALLNIFCEKSPESCNDLQTKKYYHILIKTVLESKLLQNSITKINIFITPAILSHSISNEEVDLAGTIIKIALRFFSSLSIPQQESIEYIYRISSIPSPSFISKQEFYTQTIQIFHTSFPLKQEKLWSIDKDIGLSEKNFLLKVRQNSIFPLPKESEEKEEILKLSFQLEHEEKIRQQALQIVKNSASKILCEHWHTIFIHYAPLLFQISENSTFDPFKTHVFADFQHCFIPFAKEFFFPTPHSFTSFEKNLFCVLLEKLASFFEQFSNKKINIAEHKLTTLNITLYKELTELFNVLFPKSIYQTTQNQSFSALLRYLFALKGTQLIDQLLNPYTICLFVDQLLKNYSDLLKKIEELETAVYSTEDLSENEGFKQKVDQHITMFTKISPLKSFVVENDLLEKTGNSVHSLGKAIIQLGSNQSNNLDIVPKVLQFTIQKEKNKIAEIIIQFIRKLKSSQISFTPTIFIFYLLFHKNEKNEYIPSFLKKLHDERDKIYFQRDLKEKLKTQYKNEFLRHIHLQLEKLSSTDSFLNSLAGKAGKKVLEQKPVIEFCELVLDKIWEIIEDERLLKYLMIEIIREITKELKKSN